MNDERNPLSFVRTNYLPIKMNIEMHRGPPRPPSETSTWRYNPNLEYFDCNITLTILTQRETFQVLALCGAPGFNRFRILGLSQLSRWPRFQRQLTSTSISRSRWLCCVCNILRSPPIRHRNRCLVGSFSNTCCRWMVGDRLHLALHFCGHGARGNFGERSIAGDFK